MGRFITNLNIESYDPLKSYDKYDVVCLVPDIYPIYFVSASNSNVGNLDTVTYTSNSSWKRFDDNSFLLNSVWTPSYQTTLKSEPKYRIVPLGDGYSQKMDTSIFFNRLSYEMTIENCSDKELRGILALCEYKAGSDYVLADVPPFITGRRFIIKNWRHTYNSDNMNGFAASMFEYMGE